MAQTPNPWQAFFDGHAARYLDEPFTRATETEVAFLEEILALRSGARILDVGCGTGRHAVRLARDGYRVTGVDISAGMLARASEAACAADVSIELLQADATRMEPGVDFDAAICLCEGAFTLLGADDDPDEHDRAILRRIRAALRPGAPFVLTASSALRQVRRATDDDVAAGRFDPTTLVETSVYETEGPEGPIVVEGRERSYMPGELARVVREAGFVVEHVWGGTAGDWGARPVRLDEYELMVVARANRGVPDGRQGGGHGRQLGQAAGRPAS